MSEQVASVGPKMFSEAIFEDLIPKNFLGSMPIDSPSCCMIVVMHVPSQRQVPSATYAFHVRRSLHSILLQNIRTVKKLSRQKKLGNTSVTVQHSDTKQLSNVDDQVVNLQ